MMNDPILKELMQIKHDIAAENDFDLSKVVDAIRAFNAAHPAPPTPRHRKMIKGHPIGRSCWRDDPILTELYKVKEQLSAEYASGKGAFARPVAAKSPKVNKNPGSFRTSKTKTAAKHRGNGHP